MSSPKLFRSALLLAAGVLAPLFLTQCKTTASKTYKDVSYDSSKLKTPAGHGMERKNYPFDEQGNYRKDWVKNNSTGRDRSASGSASAPQIAATENAAPSSGSYPTYAEASAARTSTSANLVGPADGSAPAMAVSDSGAVGDGDGAVVLASAGAEAPKPTASYHKVGSGDTLFALANRYNTSISELKRVNGLTGDSIRVGQSLRLP